MKISSIFRLLASVCLVYMVYVFITLSGERNELAKQAQATHSTAQDAESRLRAVAPALMEQYMVALQKNRVANDTVAQKQTTLELLSLPLAILGTFVLYPIIKRLEPRRRSRDDDRKAVKTT